MKRSTFTRRQARMRPWLIAGCVAAVLEPAQIVFAGEHSSEAKRAAIVVSPGEGPPTSRFGRLKAASEDTLGAYALLEGAMEPGEGPPPHTHSREDEAWYVLEGELSFQVGLRVVVGTPGTFVLAPRGIRHRFWNSGKRMARYLLILSPPGLEKYFQERLAISGRDPSKSLYDQSPDFKEKEEALSRKYGLASEGEQPTPTR